MSPPSRSAWGKAAALIGEFAGVTSAARRDADHLGVEMALGPGRAELRRN